MTESIIIFRNGSLGDTVVALPAFHRIARTFPDARRILMTDSPVSQKAAPAESLLNGSGLIHDVIHFPPPPRRLADLARLRRRVRATGARTVIYVADRAKANNAVAVTLRDLAFFHACGLHRIIGSPLRPALRHLEIDPSTGNTEREAERLLRCLASLGSIKADDPAAWDLRLQSTELRAADVALEGLHGQPFIAINLGGKVAVKDWGDDNWVSLLSRIAAVHHHTGLVAVGSGDEAGRAAAIAAGWPAGFLNLCGRLSPRESAAVLQRAIVFVGHDSGPLHLAAAVGTPCVGIYGNHNMPKWWHPFGAQHRILHDMGGVRLITPSRVMEAIEAAMASRERPTARAAR